MVNNWKKDLIGFDAWKNAIDELAKNAPDDAHFDEELDKIIAQLEADNLSSLGPELCAKIKLMRKGLQKKKEEEAKAAKYKHRTKELT